MRRIAAFLIVPVVGCAALAGCGSSSAPSSGDANKSVSVSGGFNNPPKITIPASVPGTKLDFNTAIKGTGSALVSGDVTLANVVLYKWTGTKHSLLDSTFKTGPQLIPTSVSLPGLATALTRWSCGPAGTWSTSSWSYSIAIRSTAWPTRPSARS